MYCIVGFKILNIIDVAILLWVLLYVLSGCFQMIYPNLMFIRACGCKKYLGKLPDRATIPVLRVFGCEMT